nr:hypothetical protein BaRGS_026045 [Batillaria attramentaria]
MDMPTPAPGAESASILEEQANGSSVDCTIWPLENMHRYIEQMEDEKNVNLFKITFRFQNSSYRPFHENIANLYKPYLWYRTRSRHGRTLLMLSFNYDVLSMNILTIGVTDATVTLQDGPPGCFNRLTPDGKMTLTRLLLLSRYDTVKRSSYGQSAREEYVCNQVIKDNDGYAEFVYNCCTRTVQGDIVCSDDDDDKWITILYFAITLVKVMMFLFCPKFLPTNMYSAMYVAAEYVVKLKQDLKMKLFVSEQTDANVRFKHRLTLEDVSDWWRFREFLDTVPSDEIVPIKMSELRIKVKGKRIIPENEPPTGLLRTIYDNLCRCKIKQISAFRDCCETSVYASMEPKFRHRCTWHMFVQALVKGVLLLLVPFPYYMRLFIYYNYEDEEMTTRRDAIARLDLTEKFDLYRTNVIQYFTPFHGIFIATYCFYFFAGLVIGFSTHGVRDKLKDVARKSLQDMSNVSQTGVLGVIIRTMLFPYRKCGLLAFLIAPFYGVVIAPLCLFLFLAYCVPTVYLSHRLPFHAKKLIGRDTLSAEARTLKMKRMRKLGHRISKVDKAVHKDGEEKEEETCCPQDLTFSGFATVRDLLLQIACSAFCLCILYSLALIFAESMGLIIEFLAFTMMGIIVNAGSVLKYVTMVLLVFVYMHDCYDNVYDNYLTFNKSIIDDMIDRTTDDLRKIAAMSSSQQANAAFLVKTVDEDDQIQPQLNFDKKEIRWKLGQLLLFLDSYDTPRIPLRLFQKLCQVRVHGAPGPVYLNLLAATGKFMIIVVFLMFVMIVVMAFGNVMAMSSTNTTLATMAGGFVPMLLKNVLSRKGQKLSLKTISFKGQMDEIIAGYKQYWPALDLIVQRDIPEAEEENNNDNEGDENKEGATEKDKSDDKGKDKDKKDDKKDEKGDKNGKEKSKDVDAYVKKKPGDAGADDKKDKKAAGEGATADGKVGDASNKPGDTEEDDNLVDLFVDLSVADAMGGWSIYGSTESLPQDSIMPAYFNPNQVQTVEICNDVITFRDPGHVV